MGASITSAAPLPSSPRGAATDTDVELGESQDRAVHHERLLSLRPTLYVQQRGPVQLPFSFFVWFGDGNPIGDFR
jgi:hypothetical protein